MDDIHYKVREDKRVIIKTVYVVIEVNLDGNREVFGSCMGLKEVVFPNSLKLIDKKAFANSGLEKVYIPSGVNIEAYAFKRCTSLTSVIAEKGVKIDKKAFDKVIKIEYK